MKVDKGFMFLFKPISLVAVLSFAALQWNASAQWADVGNAGNANDSTGYGAVGIDYKIAQFEVLNWQYAAFLTAVAVTDTYGLYNPNMAADARGGILQSGVAGSYSYSLKVGYENKPVVFVSFYDSLRFVNWMQNGQPGGLQGIGTTETGTYTFTGAASVGSRNSLTGSYYALASENEWYKAAYHQPSAQGGDADDYWLYPTRSNTTPDSRTPPNGVANSGNFYRDDALANGINGGYAVSQSTVFNNGVNYLSDGGAYSSAGSFYGTYDQGGNVFEWTEDSFGANRITRGGSWDQQEIRLRSSSRLANLPTSENYNLGFRLVVIPEPSAFALMGAGLMLLFFGRRLLAR